jgi:hypothetical protein
LAAPFLKSYLIIYLDSIHLVCNCKWGFDLLIPKFFSPNKACNDLPGSESTAEELRCLAGWKEGSKHYLVGELVRQHVHSQEQLYRCFIYELLQGSGHQQIVK